MSLYMRRSNGSPAFVYIAVPALFSSQLKFLLAVAKRTGA